jgi:rhodanese-related sulfurtransferase
MTTVKFTAHGANQSLVGTDVKALKGGVEAWTAAGYPGVA